MGGRCTPPFSMWWYTQWCVTGYCWWREAREGSTGRGGRCFTALTFLTHMTTWSRQRTRCGCRGCLTPSPGYSTGWGSRKNQEDIRDALPLLPCGCYPVGGVLRSEYDRRGTKIPVLSSVTGSVP